MRILLTNDDGIEAHGLQCLYEVLSRKAECFVVAPDRGRSCCAHAVTTHEPLNVVSQDQHQWSISGTPADCVRAGLLVLDLKPDLVISGINHGGNLGVDILYSGTVAGAREANLMGVPSIAISQYMRRDVAVDWTSTAERADFVLESVFQRKRLGLGFWNINLPALSREHSNLHLPISLCELEQLPMSFSFEEVDDFAKVSCENAGMFDPKALRTVLYKSNYQSRPRSLGSDVDRCFSGHATVSWLKTD